MNSQILAKISYFIKNRLVELLGFLLILTSIFLLTSIISYSPSDPNFIYTSENTEIKNIGGFYGSVLSDLFLQSLGLVSFFLVFNFFYWGVKLISNKKINNFITKVFFVFIYLVFGTTVFNILYNDSFWLIDNGNGGFVGRIIRENIYYFTPLINNTYVIYGLILLAFIFFILSLGIKINEIKTILYLPFNLIKKITDLIKGKKEKQNTFVETPDIHAGTENVEQKNTLKNQPF